MKMAAHVLNNETSSHTRVPFRELPQRPRMATPEWVCPCKDDADVHYQLNLINGVYQMCLQQEDTMNELISTFETRDDDIFVCTFVKSGTTWTQHIINLLLHEGEQGEKNYTEVVPWLELLAHGGAHSPEAMNWTLDTLKSTPDRRFMKTHANLKDLPAGMAKGLKVLYVARNPKDVCVSLFHHAKDKPLHGFDGDMSDMIQCFVRGRCENGSWFNHVLEWWEAAKADPEHVVFITYEAMLKQPEEHIVKIADFLGIKHTPEIVAKTAAASTISAMKKNSKANVCPHINHLRNGRSGGWREVFTVRESEEFDKIYLQQMEGTGLKFDFGEGLVM